LFLIDCQTVNWPGCAQSRSPSLVADDPDPRYVLTQQARDYLARERAMQACSGQSRA
jgi:hypothetical protein